MDLIKLINSEEEENERKKRDGTNKSMKMRDLFLERQRDRALCAYSDFISDLLLQSKLNFMFLVSRSKMRQRLSFPLRGSCIKFK